MDLETHNVTKNIKTINFSKQVIVKLVANESELWELCKT